MAGGWRWGIRIGGWVGVVALLAWLRYPDGKGFSMNRSDIIIVVLANMAVFGSLLWWLTRANLMLCLTILLVVGLKARWLVATTLITFALCAPGWWRMSKPGTATEPKSSPSPARAIVSRKPRPSARKVKGNEGQTNLRPPGRPARGPQLGPGSFILCRYFFALDRLLG